MLTGKHSRQLVGIIESGFVFQLGDHTTLTIIRSRSHIDQSIRKFTLVELLEDVLVINERENDHL
jgi:hypothetical protein